MLNEKIEEFIKTTNDAVVLDYVNGQFVLENKSFVEGKINSSVGKIQGIGSSIETCVDNFLQSWEQKKQNIEKKEENKVDIESYRWYSSH